MQHWPAAVSDEFSFGRSGVRQSAGGGLEPTHALREMSCRAKSRHLSIFLGVHKRAHVFKHPTPNIQRSMKTLAGGGARTHTALRPLDFESSASANSATPAFGILNLQACRQCSTLRRL